MKTFVRKLYYKIPDYIRYGSLFRAKYEFLNKTQWWSEEQLLKYQLDELKKIIKHAYETVPYYTRIFNELKIKPEDIKEISDLKKIPYLTKQIIYDNKDELISKQYKKNRLKYVTTGGSTGVPMGLYVDDKYDKPNEWAFVDNIWSRAFYNPKKINRFVIIRGNKPKNGLFEYSGRDLILSSYQLNNENIIKYIELIVKFNPDFIQAYPSSINMIAEHIIRNKLQIDFNNLKGILCASENLYDYQRRNIELAFGKRAFSFYGHTEHSCIAGECEESTYYHLQSEYGFTEILNNEGYDVHEEDEIGEIVVTGFNNYAMPLIRYKTADLAINTNEKCKCGRNYKLIKGIYGREQDFVITKNGSKVSLTSIIFAQHFQAFRNIKKMQMVQNEKGKIIINIIKHEGFSLEDELEIKRTIQEITLHHLDISIEYVDNIERTKRGKHRMLVQNLDLNKYY